jgi:YHYH protein
MRNSLSRAASRPRTAPFWVGAMLLLASCGSAATPATHSASPAQSPGRSASPSAAGVPSAVWTGTVSKDAIPLGDGKVSSTPRAGYVDSCTTSFRGGGAQHSGSWINTTAGTWNGDAKISVQGSVTWPQASHSFTVDGTARTITTNDLPADHPTGTFPISASDPAYQYDRNPNQISPQNLSYKLPQTPAAAATPSCLGLGAIGIATDGVIIFDALDAAGRDAGAHEIQDSCGGHPQMAGMYHYHTISSCVIQAATGASTLIGYAFDGYGIYAERDAAGNLPTDADLDACHGRTSAVMWDGHLTTMYHYDVTLEYPYTLGCYHGTPAVARGPGG